MAPTLVTSIVRYLTYSILVTSAAVNASSIHHARLHSRRYGDVGNLQKRDPTVGQIPGWDEKGCYTDDSNSRTLYEANFASDTLTEGSCINYCSSLNYPYAGVEYGRECYCGRSIAASGEKDDESQCLFPCAGDNTQKCGGNSHLTIFHNSSDVASASPPAINAGPPGWGYLGCYVDSQETRTLPYGAATLGGGNNMTVSNCATECKRQNYQYAGVEYSGECYCGNTLPDSMLAPDSETGCSRLCNGNATEYCGGANRLNAYGFGSRSTIVSRWGSLGCYNDSTASRTLRYAAQVPGGYSNMTITGCQSACLAMGYSLAGLEYAQECFCDNTFQNFGAPVSDGRCSMACRGDRSTFCGGSNGLNVYGYDGTGASTSTTTSQATTTTSASVVTTTTTNTTTIKPTATGYTGNWTYQGCYIDNAYGRILNAAESPQDTTIDSCITTCTSTGYSVAGIEYTYQCFCGDYLFNGAALTSDTDCNMPCGGNENQKCGAGNRMSIYSASTNITTYKVPKTKNDTLPGNWTYSGCLAEQQGGRVFGHFVDAPVDNNVTGCLTACGKFGYSAAGLQYGEQCFCGDDWDRLNAGVAYIAESLCDMSCPGDRETLCGGPNAFSYYTTTDTPNWRQAHGYEAGSYDFLIGGLVIPLITQIGVNGKVVLTEKHGTGPPNSTGAYELDVSQVGNGMDAAWREMYGLQTDVFCSAGFTLPDKAGRILNVGGWSGDSTFGVRLYWPDGSDGVKGVNDWEENYEEVSLQTGRWYPGAMQMANGSILVIGGESGSNGPPVPNAEILPKPAGGYLKYYDWLERTDPYNLYPFLCVLPTGNIAVFYYNEARILDENTLDTVRQLPNIPGSVENAGAGRTYPLEGTAMLLPQHAPYTDPLKVIICGGSTAFTGLALDNCVQIAPEDPSAKWELERMPDKRVITCMTALPDGTYLILNGANQGQAGFGLAQDPAHMAMLYDPTLPFGSRFTRMANTTIDRLYHSEAILLMDGRVLVSGSDPEDGVHEQEYRFETFTPPYLMGNLAASRPVITVPNADWAFGQSYTITINSGSVSKISLMAAVASTHGNSMGQRTIFPAYSCSGNTCTITAPPNAHVAGGPGWHMLFVMNANGTPSMGKWVRIGGDPAELGNWPDFGDFTLPGL